MTVTEARPVGGGTSYHDVIHPRSAGTRACYLAGCRATECVDANAAYKRERQRREARPDVVDLGALTNLGAVRHHIEELRGQGVGLSAIAKAARVDIRTLHRIIRGEVKRITLDTEDRILAVFPSNLAPGTFIPFDQVASLVEEIVSSGMSRGALAREVYGPSTKANDIGRGDRDLVRKSTADRIREIHTREVRAEPDEDSLGVDPIEGLRVLMVQRLSMRWRDRGRCQTFDLGDPRRHPFFPKRGQKVDPGRDICDGCPVIEPCLEFALESDEIGVWGGTTEAERRIIRRERQAVA